MEASQATALRAGPLAPVWRMLGDEQLARVAGSGNDHAFAALYARYRPVLRSYCASIVLDAADADDVVQATMIKAMNALPKRDTEAPVRPWLFRIAHNEAIDVLRRRRNYAPQEALNDVFVPGPDAGMANRERITELVADLRTLPERQSAALVMRELSGLTYEEVGQALELSPGAARQAVFEARTALHDFARGRETACTTIQRSLSDGDRRRWRTRSVRAHLRACQSCRSFEGAISRRGEDLALLPPMVFNGAATVAIAGGLLSGMVGIAGGGGAPAVGIVAGVAGGSAAKTLAGAAAAVVVGSAALGGGLVTNAVAPSHRHKSHRAVAARTALSAPTPVAYVTPTSHPTPSLSSGGSLHVRSRHGDLIAVAHIVPKAIKHPDLHIVREPVDQVSKTVKQVTAVVDPTTKIVQQQTQQAMQQARNTYTQAMQQAADATRNAMQVAGQMAQDYARRETAAAMAQAMGQAQGSASWRTASTAQADIAQQAISAAQVTVSQTVTGIQQMVKGMLTPR